MATTASANYGRPVTNGSRLVLQACAIQHLTFDSQFSRCKIWCAAFDIQYPIPEIPYSPSDTWYSKFINQNYLKYHIISILNIPYLMLIMSFLFSLGCWLCWVVVRTGGRAVRIIGRLKLLASRKTSFCKQTFQTWPLYNSFLISYHDMSGGYSGAKHLFCGFVLRKMSGLTLALDAGKPHWSSTCALGLDVAWLRFFRCPVSLALFFVVVVVYFAWLKSFRFPFQLIFFSIF